jgi:hypothetical protein
LHRFHLLAIILQSLLACNLAHLHLLLLLVIHFLLLGLFLGSADSLEIVDSLDLTGVRINDLPDTI